MICLKIIDIKVKDAEGSIIHLEQATLIKDIGIKGDINAKGGDRQISILNHNTKESLEELKHMGLCIPKFFENFIVKGLDISQISVGQKLHFGDAIIEITQIGKECFSNCRLVQSGKICDLATETIFAKVVKTGTCQAITV